MGEFLIINKLFLVKCFIADIQDKLNILKKKGNGLKNFL